MSVNPLSIQRWAANCDGIMDQDYQGDWVSFEDHQAIKKIQDDEIASLKKQISERPELCLFGKSTVMLRVHHPSFHRYSDGNYKDIDLTDMLDFIESVVAGDGVNGIDTSDLQSVVDRVIEENAECAIRCSVCNEPESHYWHDIRSGECNHLFTTELREPPMLPDCRLCHMPFAQHVKKDDQMRCPPGHTAANIYCGPQYLDKFQTEYFKNKIGSLKYICPYCGEANNNPSGFCCEEHEEGRRMI